MKIVNGVKVYSTKGYVPRQPKTVAQRFWPKVAKASADECWLWTAGLFSRHGYGQFRKHKYANPEKAHRVSWELHNGPIPNGLNVLHRCDIRPCVNPNHLFLGTQADNIADMVAKGRSRPVPHYGPRLSPLSMGDRTAIRASNAQGVDLAVMYRVSPATISRIRTQCHERRRLTLRSQLQNKSEAA